MPRLIHREKRTVVSATPLELRQSAYERDNFTCQNCGYVGKPGRSKNSIQADHIKAIAVGGEHSLDNLITLCFHCHRVKRHSKGWLKAEKAIYKN